MWDATNKLTYTILSWSHTIIITIVFGGIALGIVLAICLTAYLSVKDLFLSARGKFSFGHKYNVREGVETFYICFQFAWGFFLISYLAMMIIIAIIYAGATLLFVGNLLIEYWNVNRTDAPFAIALIVGFAMMFLYKSHKLIAGVGAALFLTAASHWIGQITFLK